MKNIAIIPARSGSKGLTDKNIRNLNGQPLISYSIDAAIQSGMFDTVMVSTDSQHYADIAIRYGAEIPFLRSNKTSSDTASSWDVVTEVLENYEKMGHSFDTFMLLQPTSPLRTVQNIRDAFTLLDRYHAMSIVSLCEADHSPLQYNVLPANHSLECFINKASKGKRRQDLDTYYRFNGAIYLSRTASFLTTGDIYKTDCYAYIMDKKSSVDIDDEYDFIIAEALLKYQCFQGNC